MQLPASTVTPAIIALSFLLLQNHHQKEAPISELSPQALWTLLHMASQNFFQCSCIWEHWPLLLTKAQFPT